MCQHCADHRIDRRRLIALAACGLTAAGATLAAGPAALLAAEGPKTSLTPDQALAALLSGNGRYVADPQVCLANLAKRRTDVAGHQAPWATIVGCADSRVPPELLFGGLGVGELFVARNAGNLVDIATMGTVEYGSAVLGSPLVVVLGHERCGAVAAACDAVAKNAKFPGSIGPMIAPIVPVARAVRRRPGDFVDNAIRESANRTAHRLATASPLLSRLVRSGKLKIVAARYGLADGKVEILAPRAPETRSRAS